MLSNRNKKVIDRIKADRESARGKKAKPKWKDIDYLLALVETQDKITDDAFVLEFKDKECPEDGWQELDGGNLAYVKDRFLSERELDQRNEDTTRYRYRFVRQITKRLEIYKPEDLTD